MCPTTTLMASVRPDLGSDVKGLIIVWRGHSYRPFICGSLAIISLRYSMLRWIGLQHYLGERKNKKEFPISNIMLVTLIILNQVINDAK